MEDPKTVVKTEQRKSLLVLFVMSIVSMAIGAILLFGPSAGPSAPGNGAGWVMIVGGVIAMGIYFYARKTGRP